MKFQSLLNLLQKPKSTAAELRDALASLDTKAAEAAVDALEAQRHALLLKAGADSEIEDIETKIRAGNREIERLHAGKTELTRLLTEAEAREHTESIEARAASARDVQAAMISKYLELHDAATQVAELLRAIDTGRRQIQQANQELLEVGRNDLKIQFPEIVLAERHGWNPQSLPAIAAFALPGYWPARSSDRLFDRMGDLVPTAPRRAA